MKNFDYKKFLIENKLTADSRNINEMNLYNLADLPSDVEWQEGGVSDMGTENPLAAEPSERESYDVQVYGYSPSTDKSYEGLAGGSYGETDFDTIDNIEEIPNKRNPYYPGEKSGISDSTSKGMFAVEKPNGQVVKNLNSYKEAVAYIDKIDPDGMIDFNIRKV